jgi:hypothetical protein
MYIIYIYIKIFYIDFYVDFYIDFFIGKNLFLAKAKKYLISNLMDYFFLKINQIILYY